MSIQSMASSSANFVGNVTGINDLRAGNYGTAAMKASAITLATAAAAAAAVFSGTSGDCVNSCLQDAGFCVARGAYSNSTQLIDALTNSELVINKAATECIAKCYA